MAAPATQLRCNDIEFMTGNPQLGMCAGLLSYFPNTIRNIDDEVNSATPNPFQKCIGWTLPQERGSLLCISSMPAHMVPTSMLHFFAPFRKRTRCVRIFRHRSIAVGDNAAYIIVLHMMDQDSADSFFHQYHHQPFSSMESALCDIVFVSHLQFELESDTRSLCCYNGICRGNVPLSGTWEEGKDIDELCVICMERMIDGGTLTTACNHTFHLDCIARLQDSPCPVCRFHHNIDQENSTCQGCGSSANLYVCLICGYVGCGGYERDSHMSAHHISTLHAYALNIETQQVWDFAGGGFVHRLIHNKADGKLVEVEDPRYISNSGERPQAPLELSDVQEEQFVHEKLEGLALQYNSLLKTQMDQQRTFYEKQISKLLEDQEKDPGRATSGEEVISALRQERKHLHKKVANFEEHLKKITDDIKFQSELYASLEANQHHWEVQLNAAKLEVQDSTQARAKWVPELEAKVAELMLKLDESNIVDTTLVPTSNSNGKNVDSSDNKIIEACEERAHTEKKSEHIYEKRPVKNI